MADPVKLTQETLAAYLKTEEGKSNLKAGKFTLLVEWTDRSLSSFEIANIEMYNTFPTFITDREDGQNIEKTYGEYEITLASKYNKGGFIILPPTADNFIKTHLYIICRDHMFGVGRRIFRDQHGLNFMTIFPA